MDTGLWCVWDTGLWWVWDTWTQVCGGSGTRGHRSVVGLGHVDTGLWWVWDTWTQVCGGSGTHGKERSDLYIFQTDHRPLLMSRASYRIFFWGGGGVG